MLLPNCGSFLTVKEKSESNYNYNKPLIRLCCVGFLVFSLTSLATMGVAAFYATYTAPHSTVPLVSYSKAHAASSRVTKSLSTLREARPLDIDVCRVVNLVSDSTVRSNGNISIKDISVKPQNYTIKGIGKDIPAVNDYLKSLDFAPSRYDKQLSDIKSNPSKNLALPPMPGSRLSALNNPNEVPVEFTIVVTPKVANKKAPAPKPAAQNANAAKGGKA